MHGPVGSIHVWGEYDNWWDLAHHYTGHGANWPHLLHSNPQITNPNLMVPGTKVMIPKELMQ